MSDICDELEAMITRTVSDDMTHHTAAMTIRSLRAELADARAPDCRLCRHLGIASKPTGLEYECILAGTNAACADGHKYTGLIPVRLYEKE
jgi:hypothetical protein